VSAAEQRIDEPEHLSPLWRVFLSSVIPEIRCAETLNRLFYAAV
jgi:hypothetical protein